mmetsp:Transcript_40744/g.128192  ORF Transcript_40744/g.128192 Transcript_40744/m.128192 type:complete len:84 (-) Transcript_40744:36-287(-)
MEDQLGSSELLEKYGDIFNDGIIGPTIHEEGLREPMEAGEEIEGVRDLAQGLRGQGTGPGDPMFGAAQGRLLQMLDARSALCK